MYYSLLRMMPAAHAFLRWPMPEVIACSVLLERRTSNGRMPPERATSAGASKEAKAPLNRNQAWSASAILS